MKKIIYFSLILISNLYLTQNLTIQETVDYINSIEPNDYGNFKSVDKYGVFKFKTFWVWETLVDYKDVKLEKIENVGSINILLSCKYNIKCIKSTNENGESNFEQSLLVKQLKDRENANKIYNAMEYLFKITKETSNITINDNDPFSSHNYKK